MKMPPRGSAKGPFNTRTGRQCAWHLSRAQRLAASMESSLVQRLRALSFALPSAQRLAASMESSPCDRPWFNRLQSKSAQRLAASMESSPGTTRVHPRTQPGAQRLAASMESSRPGMVAADAALDVLNALRHQWNPHCTALSYADQLRMRCSTPCGINGILTLTVELRSCRSLVLNALRHQWNPHRAPAMPLDAGTSAQRLAASMESSRCAFIGG